MRITRHGTAGAAVIAMTLALAGCAPQVPDSGAGVGFENYGTYQAQREAQLQGQTGAALPPASAVSTEPLTSTSPDFTSARSDPAAGTSNDPSALAAETRAALQASAGTPGQSTGQTADQTAGLTTASDPAQMAGTAPLQADPSNPPPDAVNSFGISQENDFDAVGAQRSIADDKAYIASARSQYQQVQPSALPSRTGTGPNIVAYALQTTNVPGQPVYRRVSLTGGSRAARKCSAYASPDLAQSDFLKNGGPERDRLGLDPDGDGFACSWDPRPFRTARGG